MPTIGWLFVAIVLGGIIIGSLIQRYRYRKLKLIYTAFGQENYFNIISKLNSADVPYKVKVPMQGMGARERSIVDNTQYDIFVKKEEAHRAGDALRK
ncbi:hypothetical protein AWM68_03065 [Fictibacillus phosphorivorans]|uniref:DUF2007 domain-containing protein n=1 Tax=Fictibacillus phosphorivorans TaxID=1221500 RepID=A0A165P7S4_9BACL|nr:hypothetical protein [Fictibacillus phosphorivorans]KZE69263.1 hypothetical protein AWM68_03065 [Fictibacillus phosphorivorans]